MEDSIIISALKHEMENLDSSDKKKPIEEALEEIEEIKKIIIEIKEMLTEEKKGWW